VCADMNGVNLIRLAEMRRAELLQEAARYQLARQAQAGNTKSAGRRRGTSLRAAVTALGTRINAMGSRRAMAKPIDLEQAGA
jgi:hypothetical protein